MYEIDDPVIDAAERAAPSPTEVLWRTHADELVRFATVLVGPSDAPDIVTDVFMRSQTVLGLATITNARAYLFRAVTNRAYTELANAVLDGRRSALSLDDTAAIDELATQVQSTADAAIAAGHSRAVDIGLTPLLDILNGLHPETQPSDWDDCPTWSTQG